MRTDFELFMKIEVIIKIEEKDQFRCIMNQPKLILTNDFDYDIVNIVASKLEKRDF